MVGATILENEISVDVKVNTKNRIHISIRKGTGILLLGNIVCEFHILNT